MSSESLRPDELESTEKDDVLQLPNVGQEIRELVEAPCMSDEDKLTAKREAGELHPEDFDINAIHMILDAGFPLRRSDVISGGKGSAIVLTDNDIHSLLDALGNSDPFGELLQRAYESIAATTPNAERIEGIVLLSGKGEFIRIERGMIPEDARMIIFPEELGDEIGKPSLGLKKAESDPE